MCYNKFHNSFLEGVPMKKKPKQIAAIICIILLVLLYIATLVVSLLDFPGSDRLFAACLLATCIPLRRISKMSVVDSIEAVE